MLGGGEAQAARGRQRHLGHHADDERQACRLQALLHGPKRFACALRLDEEARGGSSPQKGQAVPVGQPAARGPARRASTTGSARASPAASCAKRRTASRTEKPSAAAHAPARDAGGSAASGFTSCRAAASRPPARRRSSWGAPSVHARAARAECTRKGQGRQARRVRARRCARANLPEGPPCADWPLPERRGGTRRSGSGKKAKALRSADLNTASNWGSALAARSAVDGRTVGWGMGPPGPRERSRNF